jgi:Uma2 family endonuclease
LSVRLVFAYDALMAEVAQRIVRFDELWEAILALPEGVTGEIVAPGTIETMSRPGRAHRRAAGSLAFGTGGRLGFPQRGWVIESEIEVRFGELLLVPDLAGWRLDERGDAFLAVAPIERMPTWVCEILSPTTRDKDRNRKLPLYLTQGVEVVWLVDPDGRTIEVFVDERGQPSCVAHATAPPERSFPPIDLPLDPSGFWED